MQRSADSAGAEPYQSPPPDSLNLSEKDTQRAPVVSLLVVSLLATTVLMHTCICAYM